MPSDMSTSLPEGEGLIFDSSMGFILNKQNPHLYIYTKNDLQGRSFGLLLASSLHKGCHIFWKDHDMEHCLVVFFRRFNFLFLFKGN